MKFNMKVIEVWAKWFVYTFFVYSATIEKTPFMFSQHEWFMALNNIWYALVPVAIAWANPHHDLTLTIPTTETKPA